MRHAGFLLIIIVLLSLAVDVYVFQGVLTLCSTTNPKVSSLIYTLYWLVSVILLATLLLGVYKAISKREFNLLFKKVFNAFLIIFVSKLVFSLFLITEDVFRMLAALFYSYPPRSILVSQIALLCSAIPFFSFIFGVTRGKYHYKVRRVVLYFPDLPQAFDGFTITQISDVHSGSLDSVEGVQKGINLINAQQSDLFVFTGDLVNNKASEVEPWIEMFKQIKAPSGKFSILGNHDYGDYVSWSSMEEKKLNFTRLLENHRKLGFKLLLDESVEIEKNGEQITLLGVQNWGLGFGQRGNLNKALSGVEPNSIKVLLSHDPSHWDAEIKERPEKIHLTLSGHTHGMQFGIEMFGFKWSPVKYRYPNWAGLVSFNGRYLYVNRGFGFLGFAGRVGIWPEITVIELRKGL